MKLQKNFRETSREIIKALKELFATFTEAQYKNQKNSNLLSSSFSLKKQKHSCNKDKKWQRTSDL